MLPKKMLFTVNALASFQLCLVKIGRSLTFNPSSTAKFLLLSNKLNSDLVTLPRMLQEIEEIRLKEF